MPTQTPTPLQLKEIFSRLVAATVVDVVMTVLLLHFEAAEPSRFSLGVRLASWLCVGFGAFHGKQLLTCTRLHSIMHLISMATCLPANGLRMWGDYCLFMSSLVFAFEVYHVPSATQ